MMMIPTVVQQVHAHPHIRRRVPLGRLSHLSVAAAFLVAAVLMEAPEQMRVKAQSSNTQGDFSGNYDSKGSIIIVRAGALKDLPQLVTIDLNNNDITLIEANAFSNLPRLTKLDVSGNAITVVDANAFSNLPQLAMLKGDASFWQTAGPVGKSAVAVKCKPECDWLGRGSDGDGDYCQEVALTEVPTFVNKDVTD
eukprot:gene23637-8959_t